MSNPTYYTLLTAIGAADLTNAQAFGNTVPITHLAVGDGNGNPVVPTESMTELTHEVHRVPVSSMTVDVDNPNWLIIEAVLPSTVGGWTIVELGLIGGSGAGNKLLAVGNFPATYKPLIAEGAAKDLVIRMIIEISSAAIVNLTVNSGVAVATTASVANAIAAHEGKADPHPQYLTQPRGDARYRLKSDAITSADLWVTGNTTPTLPAEGGLRIHNVAGTNTLTLDISPCTVNKVALAIEKIGGGVSGVIASNGVVLNPTISNSPAALNFFTLTNKGVPQGLWSGNMTYGRRTYLAYQASYEAPLAKGAIVMGGVTCLVSATGSGLQLVAYNPVTQELGTAVVISGWGDKYYLYAQTFEIYPLDGGKFVVIGAVNAIVATLSGITITVGALLTHGSSSNLYEASCQLEPGKYLLAGQVNSYAKARVLTVSGTTLSAGAETTGPAATGGSAGRLMALGSASALFCIMGTGFVAMSVSGNAVAIGASFSTPSGSNNEYRLLDVIDATTALIFAYYTSSPGTYKLAVATVAGTTLTIGTPTSVTETVNLAPTQTARPIPYPDNSGASATRCIKIDASTWVLTIATLRAISVSGTTVTVGSAANAGATTTYMSRLPDGNLVVSDNSIINGVKPFTVAGTTITLGNLLFAGFQSNLVGHSINDFAGYKNIGGTYFSYPLIGGVSATNIASIFAIPGNATVFQGDSTSYFLRDKYI